MRRPGMIAAAMAAVLTAGVVAMTQAAGAANNEGKPAAAGDRQRAAAFPVPGGSNYNFFHLEGCDREPYGVLKNFHTRRETVIGQLNAMVQSGQRRLIIGVFHREGAESGTVMNSATGDLAPQYRKNLADLLAAVKEAGFAEVEVAFHVLAPNSPNEWTSWDERLYQQNWSLIRNLRPIIAGAGINYRINLGNELTPAPNQPFTLEYTKRLWADYTAAYGRDDTVGFSIIGSRTERIASIPQMYGDKPPYVFDLHFYGDERADEYTQFVNAHNQMRDMGLNQGWIVGEVYYDDPAAADGVRRAMDTTGREVYWLTQWPLTRARKCDHVDVTPPQSFAAYTAKGF